ncbi:MAG TPA: hypothetical protein VJV23_15435 [Candidatus Polarisedimenticolia bacterium]|nr:hypothetical protein [Candidatus Polarisedimenticolia bacterium]
MVGQIERVIEALEAAGVRYLIVGGVAVVLHGYLRTTADLDLVIQLDPPNALRAAAALTALGYRPRAPVALEEFARAEARGAWARDKQMTVFSLWDPATPTFEIDLFVTEPFDFDAVHGRAVRVRLDRTEAMVIALDDLIALKRASGRPRDLEDIEALEALRRDPGKEAR